MNSALAITLLLLAGAAGVGPAAGETGKPPVVFHVATNGNDSWSGRLPEPNRARTDGPFATITRARDAIRQLKAGGGLNAPVEVRLRGGVYTITETVTFLPEDSGTKECPISYVAAPGERPVLRGGRRITDWRPYQGKILCADLPEVKAGRWYFRQLFVDGARQVRARYPNFDPANPYRKGFLYTSRDSSAFGICVGNIHNPGDWMEYRVRVPAEGDYHAWVFYAALNKPHGHGTMDGCSVLTVDGGEAVPLSNLPDTGGWGIYRWSRSASLRLPAGERVIRWQNVRGGGLNLEAFAFTNDPEWKPDGTALPPVAEGMHILLVQAENFTASHGSQLSVGGTGTGSKTEFYYAPGTFKPSWAKATDAEIHIFQSGSCRAFKEIVSIQAVDEAARKVTVAGPECVAALHAGDRYFVENVFEELDQPGEWYLDQQEGRLYYWPARPLTPNTVVVAPVVSRMFDFAGDAESGKHVEHIWLRGLTIEATDYQPGDGCIGYGMGKEGVVHLKDARACVVEECTFREIGRYAVCAEGGGDHSICRNEISHTAQGGVLLLGAARNTVSDNHIHHLGWVYKHIGGVVLEGKGTDENVVSHNAIHDSPRYGITLKNAGVRNVIEFNRIERTNTETYDTGGIEVTQHDRNQRSGSVIRNNVVIDTIGYSSVEERPTFLSWSIYLDSFAGGYTVTNNLCIGSSHGGIMLQGGKENRVENNIFVNGRLNQGHISNFASNSEDLVLERNIFYTTSPDATLFNVGRLDERVLRAERNLYYNASGKEPVFRGGGIPSFEEWQRRGFDQNSVVADPLFVNPRRGNFALRPDSPALKLGFRPFDIKEVGPRHKPCRCQPTPPDR
ncbi:MAG: hypothetical protein GX785_08920 [Armatimonadetes bacterium]|nr:hypothetical protein [Armatimonadota bacterium]